VTTNWSSVTKSGSRASQSPRTSRQGFGRHYTPEYIHHLRFSNGSSNELQTQVELSKHVEIVGAEEAAMLIADAEEIGRMLHGLIGSLERTSR
jgi:four helix bundle protein